MPTIINSLSEWQQLRSSDIFRNRSLGLVPTMGNLHAGHQSLLKRSTAENDLSLLTIFVNPTQFNDKNDFKNYPKTIEEDIKVASDSHIDFILIPDSQSLYPDDYRYQLSETSLGNKLCGKHRPGHFTGMLTVVLKLLLLAKANRAYFGEKDYQQLQLIRGMQQAFFIDTEIVACPIVRNEQGLALSSRNSLLSSEQLTLAPRFYELLNAPLPIKTIYNKLTEYGFEVDYIEEIEGRRYGAVRLGHIRLIDNIEI